jgi:D-threo-aldose 1-dehydrogenase
MDMSYILSLPCRFCRRSTGLSLAINGQRLVRREDAMAMKASDVVELGRTGLRLSRLGLGTGPLGGALAPVSEDDAAGTVDRAWNLGLRWFDTAPFYGAGLAERRLGRALRGRPRGEYVLATKVGRLLVPGDDVDPMWTERSGLQPVFDYSYEATRRSLLESLDRLGLDRVDILHIHDPDAHYREAIEGAYPALVDLRAEGRIRAVSVGMNQSAMLADFALAGDFDCFLLAGRYTLLDQSGLADLLPVCAERGIPVIAGAVLGFGLLTGSTSASAAWADPTTLERIKAIRRICDRHGVPITAAALQFPLSHPAVCSVLVGARSADELEKDVELFESEIPEAFWEELRDVGLLRGP